MEIAAIIFALIVIAVAYVVFRLLKKTVKLAIRAIIFLIIIGVAVIGGAYLWTSSGAAQAPQAESVR